MAWDGNRSAGRAARIAAPERAPSEARAGEPATVADLARAIGGPYGRAGADRVAGVVAGLRRALASAAGGEASLRAEPGGDRLVRG